MYEIVSRPAETPDGNSAQSRGFELRMAQNRSAFPEEGRIAVSVLAVTVMFASCAPLRHGLWPIPVLVVATFAILIWCLESHKASPAPSEHLRIADGVLIYRAATGKERQMVAQWARVEGSEQSHSDLRITLSERQRSFEIARCLNLDEKRAVLPLILEALASAKRVTW